MRNAISQLLHFSRKPMDYVALLQANNQAIISQRLGPKQFHFIFDATIAGNILTSPITHFRKSKLAFNKILPITGKHGLVQLQGEDWQHMRQLTNKLFHKVAMTYYPKLLQPFVDDISTAIDQQPTNAIDINTLMINYTLNSAIRILTGCTDTHTSQQLASHFIALNRLCGERLRNPLAAPIAVPTPRNRQIKHHQRAIDQLLLPLLQQTSAYEHTSMLQLLSKHYPKPNAQQQQLILDQLRTFLFAGFETTAASLSFCLQLLAHHPQQQQRIRHSLQHLTAESLLQQSTLQHLHALKSCYQEALRLYPPAWILAREASAATELHGQHISPNDTVIICVQAIQRSTNYWENPNQFLAERFIEKTPSRFSFMPFGFGPRICSRQFASQELGQLHELFVLGQRYGSLCNTLTTMNREIKKRDMTNEVLLTALHQNHITIESLNCMDPSSIQHCLEPIQQRLKQEQNELLTQMHNQYHQLTSIKVTHYLSGLQQLNEIHHRLVEVI